jgi:PAS domain S-box-containing protein
MKDPSDNWEELRRKVLGLGDSSVRKTHYPSLRQRLAELERLRAELQQSEAELRQLIDAIPQHVIVLEPDGSPRYINQVGLDYTGLTLEESLAKDALAKTYHPDDLERVLGERRNAVSHGAQAEVQARILGADGKYRWFLIRINPLRDEQGRILRWYGTRTDIEDRKQAEDALRRSRAYLTEAQSLSHTGSFGWKPSTGEHLWSEETYRIFQYDPTTKPTLDLVLERVHPEDRAHAQQTIERASQEKKDFEHEYRLLLPDGSVKYLHIVAHALSHASGGIEFAGAVMDITAGKEAEVRIRRIINTVPALLWSARPDGWIDFISQRLVDYTGMAMETGLGWGWQAAYHPDDLEQVLSKWQAALAEGKPFEAETRIRRFDGEYRWSLGRASPLLDRCGHILGWYGSHVDIHDRKLAEEKIREQASLLNLTHDSIFMRDMQNVITYWNRGAEEFYGWTAEQVVGKITAFKLLQTVFPKPLDEIETELLRTGRWEGELLQTKADGTRVVVASRWSLQRDERQQPLAVLELNNDITERKGAEEALRQAQADLAHVSRLTTMGELAASVAHEVNQPLSGVVVNANACLRWLAGDSPNLEEARDAVRRIVRDGKRAGDVIARIRALATKTATAKERLDMNEAIREVMALAQDVLRKNSVAVRTEFAPDLLPVLGDRVQLQQVVLNLVMNGIEAMSSVEERPRQLIVRTQNDDADQVRVTVQDSGMGLDPESMERIFAAFYTTKRGGMGMGLSISRSIIENHGGRLWAVANDGPGMSVQFTIPKYQQ